MLFFHTNYLGNYSVIRMHLVCAKRSIMNQLHVHCDINDIVSEYLIGVKINPYKSYRWHEVSKVARNRNGTQSKWHEVSDTRWDHLTFRTGVLSMNLNGPYKLKLITIISPTLHFSPVLHTKIKDTIMNE